MIRIVFFLALAGYFLSSCRSTRKIQTAIAKKDTVLVVEDSSKAAIGVWHAWCSCRMGHADDPMSVVDTAGQVKGIGLRMVDASIFPVVPSTNANFPVMMTAEKISDAILAGR